MDEQRLANLLARVGDLNDFSRPRPLVTIAEFFEGNDDDGSMGYNLCGPEAIYAVALEIERRPDVHAVLVQVQDWENEPGWPSSDMLHVITTADARTVRSWFPDDVAPDEWGVDENFGPPATEAYPIPPGYRSVFCFYD